MRILGLFVVVFGSLFISKWLGFSHEAQMVGAVMAAGAYVIGVSND